MNTSKSTKEKGFMDIRSDNEQILSVEEKKIIEQLNNFASTSQKDALKDIKFFNMSLKELFNHFLLTWRQIIDEIINLYKESPKLRNNIYDKVYWWKDIKSIFLKLFDIFTRNDRLIYVGIMLIIISFFTYFLLISSK